MKWSQTADRRVVQAVVRAFSHPGEDLYAFFLPLSVGQWERSYYWLDASGMALYLYRQLEKLGLAETLPRQVRARLEQNLADNRQRSNAMFEEFAELNAAFQAAGVDYCNLKGFTLSPISCPAPALRAQLDLDFLVDGSSLDACRELLVRRGYVLRAATHKVWEFKSESNELADISNLYRIREQRCIELHFRNDENAPNRAGRDERLDRLSWIEIEGVRVPALSRVDQFVSQATHIFSHLCGPSTRMAWFVELKNHVDFRFDDTFFWKEVLQQVSRNRDAEVQVGVALLAMKEIFAATLPESLESGLLDRLPAAAGLWSTQYASRAVLADFPGTKLHLFLQEQFQPEPGTWQTTRRRALLPRRRPAPILHVSSSTSIWKRLAGGLCQLRYEAFRCRFHLVQGMAYLQEVPRWRRLLKLKQAMPQAEISLPSRAVQIHES